MSRTVLEFFSNRKVAIATQHHKESVISPLFKNELELDCVLVDGLDTDALGTFSGEIERVNSPLEAVRKKCDMAHELGYDLVVSNEGSFGPHPTIFFVPSDEEIILIKDYLRDLEIFARVVSMETNFAGKSIHNQEEIIKFASQM